MPAFEFMHTMKEFIEILNGDKRYHKQPYFGKYHRIYFREQIVKKERPPPFPKFIMFSAHQETIRPILQVLNQRHYSLVTPGSAIFFEFFTDSEKKVGANKHELYVRIFYKPSAYEP